MTAPKSCSNCGAAAPAPATSPARPGRAPPGRRPSTPLRPGAGSHGDRTRHLHVRAPALPLSATWTPPTRATMCIDRTHTMYDAVAIIRSLTDAGITRGHADAIVSAMRSMAESGTTIRPGNTSIRRSTTSANTPPRQSPRPRPGSAARCSSRRFAILGGLLAIPPTARLKHPRTSRLLLPRRLTSPPQAAPPLLEHTPDGVVGRPFVQGMRRETKRTSGRRARCENTKKARHARACRAFVFRTTDRLGGGYSASAPPARRIASVTMPTLVTPAPLAASITSMISP